MVDEPIRERTLEEKVNHVINLLAALAVRVEALEHAILPQPPGPEIGLP